MNISTLILNKYIFATYNFTYPFTLTAIHMFVCWLGARTVLKHFSHYLIDTSDAASRASFDRIEFNEQLNKILPLALLFAANIALGNVSLRFVPVSFMQTIKASVPLFTVAIQACYYRKQFSKSTYLSMGPIVGGVALASLSEANYNHIGFYAALLSSVVTALFAIVSGITLQQRLINPINLLYHMTPWSAVFLVPCSIAFEMQDMVEWLAYRYEQSLVSLVCVLLVSGSIAFLLNICTFFVIKYTSALTYTVSGNLKVILSISISIVVFRNEVGFLNAIGCAVAVIGVIWYSQIGYESKIQQQQQLQLQLVQPSYNSSSMTTDQQIQQHQQERLNENGQDDDDDIEEQEDGKIFSKSINHSNNDDDCHRHHQKEFEMIDLNIHQSSMDHQPQQIVDIEDESKQSLLSPSRLCKSQDGANSTGIDEGDTENTVDIPHEEGFSFKKLKAYLGPCFFVSVGYMDPGNWATDLEGGSRFGFALIWVLLLSNIMALFLQTLSFRVAIVTKKDLAQLCKEEFTHKPMRILMWIIFEITIAATDMAEVIGTAIGLQILFGIPLIAGVVMTSVDTLLFLAIQRWGIRKLELIIILMLAVITSCFVVELVYAKPDAKDVFAGFIPSLTTESVVVASGIIGATVMPHNLFLHSGVVKSRKVGNERSRVYQALKYNLLDTILALNGAFFVNVSILILSASIFYKNNYVVTDLKEAYNLLGDLMDSKTSSILFGIGLLCAGQSSTITGTMTGQIIMEGFLDLKIAPWLRRLSTRLLAIIPAAIIIIVSGDQATYQLLIFSQVILSIALPFAVIPLIQFTSSESIMSPFYKNPLWVTIITILIAMFIVAINAMTVVLLIHRFLFAGLASKILTCIFLIPLVFCMAILLIWMIIRKIPRIYNLLIKQ
ncbi:natural resistance-associated macrophage protein [Cavenderia fasciculata]|uniref:Natural resistance-associated macrophage protein n=1 Tax=Cavenderia fasciculata TaxID=261658 RepID=F4PIP9_CACFS|nr:natural resistance-associated macrophage protein [Cavenderia fasciculata]EGG24628.1 natural resistance-associated macrophage protein [Cavenderia fasciculata]|eukprot:XP_004362479.1 natural resistance-associated macrophage protein [Cavenderia fasciculata]